MQGMRGVRGVRGIKVMIQKTETIGNNQGPEWECHDECTPIDVTASLDRHCPSFTLERYTKSRSVFKNAVIWPYYENCMALHRLEKFNYDKEVWIQILKCRFRILL